MNPAELAHSVPRGSEIVGAIVLSQLPMLSCMSQERGRAELFFAIELKNGKYLQISIDSK